MEALAPRSDQLNADDLIPGPRVLKITGARIIRDGRDTKIVLNYEGDHGKPWKPCKTMGRAMVMAWSITDEQQMVGKSVRVYRDPEVKFGDQGAVGGIRISHLSHIDKPATMKLTVSQGKKGGFTFHPLVIDVPREQSAGQRGQTAEQWAADHIAFVTGAADLERLAAVQEGGKKAMAKLLGSHPELHEKVVNAYAKRLDELSGGMAFDGDDADDNQGDPQ
jgi:hypothetical protein